MCFVQSFQLPLSGINVQPGRLGRTPKLCSTTPVRRPRQVRMDMPPAQSHNDNSKGLNTEPKSSKSASMFTWTNQWYAVAWATNVPPGRLVSFSLFDRPYVVYKDVLTDVYVVMDDVCPHRMAPLSEGRLFEHKMANGTRKTLLECSYHGWKFDCAGKCIDVPHAPLGTRLPPTANVSGVYATIVTAFGLIFMWYGNRFEADESKLPVPSIVTAHEESKHITFIRPLARRLPVELSTLIENLADPGHVFFAHHGTTEGNRNSLSRNIRLRVMERDPSMGYFYSCLTLAGSDVPALRVSTYSGTLVHYSARTKTGVPRLDLLLYAAPTGRHETALFAARGLHNRGFWFRLLRPLVPLWIDHSHNNLTLEGDNILIQNQEVHMREKKRQLKANGRNLNGKGAWASSYIMSTSTFDALVAEYRKWNDVTYKSMPFLSADTEVMAPKRMRREEINDRYEWHVKDCVSCSAALRNLRLLRVILGAAAVIAASTMFTSMMVGLAMGGMRAKVQRSLFIGTAMSGTICLLMLMLLAWTLKGIRSLTSTDKAHELQQEETTISSLLIQDFPVDHSS